MSRAIVLLSAGLDSVVSFKLACDSYDSIKCLTFDYGQKARSKEIEFASKICATYRVSHHIIELPWYASLREHSPITTNCHSSPKRHSKTIRQCVKLQKPSGCLREMRFFFQLQPHFAKNYRYETVVVGFNREEAETFSDNSADFVTSFNRVLQYAALNQVEVVAPLIEYNKTEIAALGLRIGAPLEWSWSCYAAEDVHVVFASPSPQTPRLSGLEQRRPLLTRWVPSSSCSQKW